MWGRLGWLSSAIFNLLGGLAVCLCSGSAHVLRRLYETTPTVGQVEEVLQRRIVFEIDLAFDDVGLFILPRRVVVQALEPTAGR